MITELLVSISILITAITSFISLFYVKKTVKYENQNGLHKSNSESLILLNKKIDRRFANIDTKINNIERKLKIK